MTRSTWAVSCGMLVVLAAAFLMAEDKKPAPEKKPGPAFMGIPIGDAKRIVFLCDSSGSMMTKFDILRQELRKAVDLLTPDHSFNIVFFAEDTYVSFQKELLTGAKENKRKAYDFLDKVSPHGSSDPIPALRKAFADQPEVIYLLTDGDFPNNNQILEEVRKLNKEQPKVRVNIHTIAFFDRGEEYEKLLKQIAIENGGNFRFVAEKDLEK